jgi:hypothetical protein
MLPFPGSFFLSLSPIRIVDCTFLLTPVTSSLCCLPVGLSLLKCRVYVDYLCVFPCIACGTLLVLSTLVGIVNGKRYFQKVSGLALAWKNPSRTHGCGEDEKFY